MKTFSLKFYFHSTSIVILKWIVSRKIEIVSKKYDTTIFATIRNIVRNSH